MSLPAALRRLTVFPPRSFVGRDERSRGVEEGAEAEGGWVRQSECTVLDEATGLRLGPWVLQTIDFFF